MARSVTEALDGGRHLVVRAGTGTGKTLGYLVPAVLSGKRTVVATATRALQDQLAAKDLPFLEATLGTSFTWAVLKGRSNYVCVQRLAETAPRPARPATEQGEPGDRRRSPAHRGRAARSRRAGRARRPHRARRHRGVGRHHHDRRSRRARRRAQRHRVGRGEHHLPRLPGRGALPARRPVLRRSRPGPGCRGRRGGGQPAPVRARPRQRRGHPARARPHRHRRGARARRRDLGHHGCRDRRRPVRTPRPAAARHPRRVGRHDRRGRRLGSRAVRGPAAPPRPAAHRPACPTRSTVRWRR